jgi:hypothetical protein
MEMYEMQSWVRYEVNSILQCVLKYPWATDEVNSSLQNVRKCYPAIELAGCAEILSTSKQLLYPKTVFPWPCLAW